MKKMFLIFAACSVFAGDMETRFNQLTNLMDQQINLTVPQEVQFDQIQVLASNPGVIATIQDNFDLFRWILVYNYYHDFSVTGDESNFFTTLQYIPNSTQFASFPANFQMMYERPSTLEGFKDRVIAAAKSVAGTGYVEVTNKPDTIYNGIPGWTFSNMDNSRTTKYIWFHHILNTKNASFDICFLTTQTDFVKSTSISFYALILALADFDETTEITVRENFENLRSPLLLQNYPNPFNSMTVIPYTVSRPAHVRLEIINSNGQKVKTLIDGMKSPGNYEVNWEAVNLSNGLYFYRLIEGDQIKTNRMLLIK